MTEKELIEQNTLVGALATRNAELIEMRRAYLDLQQQNEGMAKQIVSLQERLKALEGPPKKTPKPESN